MNHHVTVPAVLLVLAATATGQWVEDSIHVGAGLVGSLVYNSCEDVVYGACGFQDGIFFAISCDSNRVMSSFMAREPFEVTYCPTLNKAYCTVFDSVLVVDGHSHTRLRTVHLEWATFCIWDSVSNCVYVSCGENDEVAVVDCEIDSVTDRIRTGQWPGRLYLNTRHHKLYVLNDNDGSVSVVDLETREVVKTWDVGLSPEVGLYCPLFDKFYCGAYPYLYVFDGNGDSLLTRVTLPVGAAPTALALAERSGLLFAGTYSSGDTIIVLDARADTVVAKLLGGRDPKALYWSRSTDLVYAAVAAWDAVAVFSGNGSGPIATFPVGDAPNDFAYSSVHRRLYLCHYNSQRVYVIRDAVGGIEEQEQAKTQPAPMQSVLAAGSFLLPGAERLTLVDACGRGVGVLEPGPNDLARLAPGVYLGLSPSGEVRLRLVKAR